MKLLFFGTGNQAKLDQMRRVLEAFDVKLVSAREIPLSGSPLEDGKTPVENAEKKARFYFAQTGLPSFAIDQGLYIDGLPPEEQPGVFVRRVKGRELSDEEMISHYCGLAAELGGKAKAHFVNAVCLVKSEDNVISYMGEDLSTTDFFLVDKPCKTRYSGYPIDSIAVDPKTGKYWAETDWLDKSTETEDRVNAGLRRFFRRALDL